MPTLKQLLELISQHATTQGVQLSDAFTRNVEIEIRKAFPEERIYIPPANSRRDPARGEEIRKAAARLSNSALCERYGISRQLAAYHTKKR